MLLLLLDRSHRSIFTLMQTQLLTQLPASSRQTLLLARWGVTTAIGSGIRCSENELHRVTNSQKNSFCVTSGHKHVSLSLELINEAAATGEKRENISELHERTSVAQIPNIAPCCRRIPTRLYHNDPTNTHPHPKITHYSGSRNTTHFTHFKILQQTSLPFYSHCHRRALTNTGRFGFLGRTASMLKTWPGIINSLGINPLNSKPTGMICICTFKISRNCQTFSFLMVLEHIM